MLSPGSAILRAVTLCYYAGCCGSAIMRAVALCYYAGCSAHGCCPVLLLLCALLRAWVLPCVHFPWPCHYAGCSLVSGGESSILLFPGFRGGVLDSGVSHHRRVLLCTLFAVTKGGPTRLLRASYTLSAPGWPLAILALCGTPPPSFPRQVVPLVPCMVISSAYPMRGCRGGGRIVWSV